MTETLEEAVIAGMMKAGMRRYDPDLIPVALSLGSDRGGKQRAHECQVDVNAVALQKELLGDYLRWLPEDVPEVARHVRVVLAEELPASGFRKVKALRARGLTSNILSPAIVVALLSKFGLESNVFSAVVGGTEVLVRRQDADKLKRLAHALGNKRRMSVRSMAELADDAGLRGDRLTARRILEAAECVTWLDERRSWFFIKGLGPDSCRLQVEMAKIVCEGTWVELEAAAGALQRAFLGRSCPETRVLARAILEWEWLLHREGSVRPLIAIDAKRVFSTAELAVYGLLRDNPRGLPRPELVARSELLGVHPRTTYRVLRNSAFLRFNRRHNVILTRMHAHDDPDA